MNRFRWFLKKNQRISYLIRRSLPKAWTGEDLKLVQDRLIPDLAADFSSPVVVDIGGGRNCYFARHLKKETSARIIAVDISPEELRMNGDVMHRVVSDATRGLPFKPESVDIIVSRSVVEHLPNTDAYFAQAGKCLRPNGYFVNVFPGKFSPFAIINAALPNKIAQKILFYLYPGFVGHCGFKAHYNNTYYSAVRNMLKKNGFEICHINVRYYQSMYYDFFVPFFIASLAYDLLLYFIGIKNLSAQIFFVARKVE